MISLYNIISGKNEELVERLNSYVSKVDCFRNTGFVKEKQKLVISEISFYICKAYLDKLDTDAIENDNDENEYRFTKQFSEVCSSLNLGINRNNILRLVKFCKKVYKEMILDINFPYKEEREICSFLEGFFDNFEVNIFDSWYSFNSMKASSHFTFDEFREIALKVSETAALGILVVRDKKIYFINQYVEKLLGYDVYELQSLDYMDIIDKRYHEFFKNRLKLYDDGKTYPEKYTLKLINKLGEEKYIDVNEKAIAANGVNVILLTIADITAYRQVQYELLQKSRSLRSLIGAMTDFVCFRDENGRWTEANETAVDLYDLHNISYKGMTNYELASTNNGFYKDAFDTCESTDEEAWKNEHVIAYEEVINKPDGRRFIYEITKAPFYCMNGGRKFIVELGKDITSKKEAELKLRESEERYRKLFELSPDAMYIRKDNKFLLANDAGIRLLGKDKLEDVRGKEPNDFMIECPDFKMNDDKYLDLFFEKNVISSAEEKFIRKSDEKVLELDVTFSLFPYEGDKTVLVIARDISEKKKAEELKIKMNQKDKQLIEAMEYDKIRNEFFANISHELRTPLNVLLGTLQLFELMSKKDAVDYSEKKLIKYTTIMKQNCYRLVKIVNNLIDITKIDSGYFPIHMSNNNIVETVENIVMSVVDYAGNKGISVQFDTDFEEKVIGYDPDKIERIMLNLLSNSIKFTECGGGIKVRIFGRNQRVLISVKDTGIGIPEDKLTAIFDRFVQVDRSLSRMNEGSGIGLSMVKSLVEMQGGTISAASKLNEGSEFIVELPDKILNENSNDTKEYYIEPSSKEKIKVEFSDIYF